MAIIPVGEGSNWNADLQAILSAMRAKGDNQLASEFSSYAQTFHAQYPQYTAQQAIDAFLATNLGKSLAAGLGGTTAVLSQLPGAAAKGAENAVSNLDVFKGLNLGSLILRIGEVILGVVLVGIGLNALLKNPIGKAASVTPVGKVL